MKVAKIRNNKKEPKQEISKESYSLKQLLLILFIIVVTLGVFYAITFFVIKDNKTNINSTNINNTQIDTSKITMGNLLNRKDAEYFVLATYSSKKEGLANYSDLYNNYISNYIKNDDALNFYYIDLDDALNKNYISDNQNITDDINNLKLNDDTLFRIKSGKIEEYFVGSSKILEKLSNL